MIYHHLWHNIVDGDTSFYDEICPKWAYFDVISRYLWQIQLISHEIDNKSIEICPFMDIFGDLLSMVDQ